MTSDIQSLYDELKRKISGDLLKDISTGIIARYREKYYNDLARYAERLGISTAGGSTARLFAAIIQVYHPDRLAKIHRDIDAYYEAGAINELARLKKIYLSRDDKAKLPDTYRVEFDEEYRFSHDDFGYNERSFDDDTGYEDEPDREDEDHENDEEFGFAEVITEVLLGDLDITLTATDLRGLDGEIDLSDYDFSDLSGIENCVNIIAINLSGNRIEKIHRLADLTNLEYLYLAGNNIESIVPLEKLWKLKELDISFNDIHDISPLLGLDALVYVNIMGNPVTDKTQIETLKKKGVVVIF